MMRQYLGIKADHPDAIVLYRMGDFYEMFLEDAERAAPLLDIALTTRDKGKENAVPMCGIPVHSAEQYIKRLADLGHRIAICEQVEDPKGLGGRRLVKRAVVEVITPGLVGDPEGLEGGQVVSVAALSPATAGAPAGLAALDASTGEFRGTSESGDAEPGWVPPLLLEELQRIAPRELLMETSALETLGESLTKILPDCVLTPISAVSFDPNGVPVEPEGFADCASEGVKRAASALLAYLGENQPFALSHAPRLTHYELGETVILDASTREHLELFRNSEDGGRKGSLIEALDRTRTPLGARRLARWIGYPLRHPEAIRIRQAGVEWLSSSDRQRQRLSDALSGVRDLERILAKAARPTCVPRDMGHLRSSLGALPEVIEALDGGAGTLFGVSESGVVSRPASVIAPQPVPALAQLLMAALVDDPPVIARGSRGAHETGYIRSGYDSDLDGIHEGARKGRDWIASLEATERERTGIPSLKVRYHPVHGYSLEISKTHLAKVPEDYERKQTLASVERFTTDALREVESGVMGANERAAALERELFDSLRRAVVESADAIRQAAEAVANLDALMSLAEVARREGWVRPEVDAGETLAIEGGRHPVVEAMLRRASSDGFVPNDTALDSQSTRILLLTGPNMSGKSTYLRQVALIVLLAQMGSFVPADSARVGAVDRIFTRVGASDRLSRGESTFMVEMRETAEILRLASRRSLIILDEIGRGTSTFDGLSIAWAVAEYLHDTPGLEARTLFATHYHELIELGQARPHIANAHFEVREWKNEVIFLRRLVAGGASRSYGIQVARLAGLPGTVIQRAHEVLAELEAAEKAHGKARPDLNEDPAQLALALGRADSRLEVAQQRVLDEVAKIDPDATTPFEALAALGRWRAQLDDC
jgi:DNA mismatch repair protein MutS